MRRAATWLAAVASVAILALGLRAFLDPVKRMEGIQPARWRGAESTRESKNTAAAA
jgi:hypothetical protein